MVEVHLRQLHELHGPDRRARRSAAERGADAGVVPGSVQRGHVEPERDLAASRGGTSSASRIRSRCPSASRSTRAWRQDDWRVTDKLTLNLGLRYDLMWDAFNNQVEFLPWMVGGRPQDADNIQPRLGFAYQLNDRTVLRGGVGPVLHRPHRQRLDPLDARQHHRVPRGRQRRASGFRDQPVQRSGAELSAGAAAGLRREHGGVQYVAGVQLRRQRAMSLPRLRRAGPARGSRGAVEQLADLVRRPAPARRQHGDRGRLREQPQPRREGPARPDQSRLQPGDRRELPVRRNGPNRALLPYPEFGLVGYYALHRQVRLSRAADRRGPSGSATGGRPRPTTRCRRSRTTSRRSR